MMTLLAGSERTEKQFHELFAAAGLKVVKFWYPEGSFDGVVEAVLDEGGVESNGVGHVESNGVSQVKSNGVGHVESNGVGQGESNGVGQVESNGHGEVGAINGL